MKKIRWKRLTLLLAAVVTAGGSAFLVTGRTAGMVRAVLPNFPQLPGAQRRLTMGQQSGPLYFETTTPHALDVIYGDLSGAIPTTGIGELFLPAGASSEAKVPALILIPGSGGITPGRERRYGAEFSAEGYAVMVIDYYRPRGLGTGSPYLLNVLGVSEFDAVADAYAALKLLSSHPGIDGDRVAVIGFSYGGMAVRVSMDRRVRDALVPGHKGFAAYVDFYGPCFQRRISDQLTGAPYLSFRGTRALSNALPVCKERERSLRKLGIDVEAHVFEGAGHGWDTDRPARLEPDMPYVVGCEVSYDADGHSLLDGEYMVKVARGSSREEHIAERLWRGGKMSACVHRGYWMGQHQPARVLSDQLLRRFLSRTLLQK